MDGELKDSTLKDIQWHPAFVSAMNLEVSYNLNIKPLEIDLLIIKKRKRLMKSGIFLDTYKRFFAQNGKIMVSVYTGRLLKVKACKIATVMDHLLHLLWLRGRRERGAVFLRRYNRYFIRNILNQIYGILLFCKELYGKKL